MADNAIIETGEPLYPRTFVGNQGLLWNTLFRLGCIVLFDDAARNGGYES
jgi:hypothetical protein